MYSVPKNEEMRRKWIESTGKHIPEKSFVCSDHFHPSYHGERKRLKDAIPFDFKIGQFCVVCGTPRDCNDSHHLFGLPKDDDQRQKWMSSLQLYIPVGGLVCSKHFPIHSVKKKYIKEGALPLKDAYSPSKIPSDFQMLVPSEGLPIFPKATSVISSSNDSENEQLSESEDSILGEIQIAPDINKDKETTSKEQVIRKSSTEKLTCGSPEQDLQKTKPNEDTTKPIRKRLCNYKKEICMMCLEPTLINKMFHLSVSNSNFPNRNKSFGKIKIMQTTAYISMIKTLMPNFDFDSTLNPIMCLRCKSLLISSFNFVEKCTDSQKKIHLYKSQFAPDEEKVSCVDVVQDMCVLIDGDQPRKKLKTSELPGNEPCSTSKEELTNRNPPGKKLKTSELSENELCSSKEHEYSNIKECTESPTELKTTNENLHITRSIRSEDEEPTSIIKVENEMSEDIFNDLSNSSLCKLLFNPRIEVASDEYLLELSDRVATNISYEASKAYFLEEHDQSSDLLESSCTPAKGKR
ncbi:hypothetical protein JTB14_015530 [Gonioctena quinquepunctata]|nr:hypothetical protein JTB14_015530 [Gonioctena quinquepunctata]